MQTVICHEYVICTCPSQWITARKGLIRQTTLSAVATNANTPNSRFVRFRTKRFTCVLKPIPIRFTNATSLAKPISIRVVRPCLSNCKTSPGSVGKPSVRAKLLAVPIDKALPIYTHWQKPDDINALRLQQIQHFFEHYKDLEPGKWVKVEGWFGPEDAKKEILAGIATYEASLNKLRF